jgi:hypothetical protein
VTEHPLQQFHVRSCRNRTRCAGVPQIVETQRREASLPDRWLPDTPSEVLQTQEAAARGRFGRRARRRADLAAADERSSPYFGVDGQGIIAQLPFAEPDRG